MATYNFPPTSRYYGLETAFLEDAEGRKVAYLRRRFLPDPDLFALLRTHQVVEGDRPDTLAATHLDDPEAFWRIADANPVMHPDELTDTIDSRVRITLPRGIPGGPVA